MATGSTRSKRKDGGDSTSSLYFDSILKTVTKEAARIVATVHGEKDVRTYVVNEITWQAPVYSELRDSTGKAVQSLVGYADLAMTYTRHDRMGGPQRLLVLCRPVLESFSATMRDVQTLAKRRMQYGSTEQFGAINERIALATRNERMKEMAAFNGVIYLHWDHPARLTISV